jgi:hypothetical protein
MSQALHAISLARVAASTSLMRGFPSVTSWFQVLGDSLCLCGVNGTPQGCRLHRKVRLSAGSRRRLLLQGEEVLPQFATRPAP